MPGFLEPVLSLVDHMPSSIFRRIFDTLEVSVEEKNLMMALSAILGLCRQLYKLGAFPEKSFKECVFLIFLVYGVEPHSYCIWIFRNWPHVSDKQADEVVDHLVEQIASGKKDNPDTLSFLLTHCLLRLLKVEDLDNYVPGSRLLLTKLIDTFSEDLKPKFGDKALFGEELSEFARNYWGNPPE